MRAIVISRPGGPEVLELREIEAPSPSRGEVRVRIRATAVNRADLLQRMGAYPAPPDSPADIPGLEFAGEVDALGDGVTGFSTGDRVYGLAGGGTYAERIVLHAATLSRIPSRLSFVEAAAVPEAFITAYDAMVSQARLAAGETVLISAVGSGVGTAALQIARAIGAKAIGSSRREDKLARASQLGLDEGVLATDGSFASEVKRLTDGRGADVVLELVGGAYVAEDLKCIAPRGRLMLVGLMAGRSTEIDLGAILRLRVELRGTVLRARPLEEKIVAAQLLGRHMNPLFESGALKPVIDRTLPLEKAGAAHELVAGNDPFGKVLLTLD